VSKEELENVALESTRTIEIDEFVDRTEIDSRYLIRPYYLRPDGKVGHDAFAVIRETIREMNKVAIGRVVLTSREHIIALEPLVNRKAGRFDPDKFEDHYETALVELINQKRAGKPITPKERPATGNVVDLMEALRRSVGKEAAPAPAKAAKPAKKPRTAAPGQKEMLMSIEGKKAKEAPAKKTAAKPQRKTA